MTKPKPKTKAATRSSTRKTSKLKPRARTAPASSKVATRGETKHARVLSMLRSSAGTTIASIMTATDWQQHSVRGFLAGIVARSLGLISCLSKPTKVGSIASRTAGLPPLLQIA